MIFWHFCLHWRVHAIAADRKDGRRRGACHATMVPSRKQTLDTEFASYVSLTMRSPRHFLILLLDAEIWNFSSSNAQHSQTAACSGEIKPQGQTTQMSWKKFIYMSVKRLVSRSWDVTASHKLQAGTHQQGNHNIPCNNTDCVYICTNVLVWSCFLMFCFMEKILWRVNTSSRFLFFFCYDRSCVIGSSYIVVS